MTPEQKIQNEIRNALAGRCLLFRANVGSGWTGNDVERTTSPREVMLYPGDVLIRNARPFSTGLPTGFSDLFGVTPDGRFFAPEVKTPDGRVSEAQEKFGAAILKSGGRAGIVRSVADALALLET